MTKITVDKALIGQAIDALENERPYLGPAPNKVVAAIIALRKALEHPAVEPMRKYVEDFAAKGGWTKDSREGAFDFVQRISYAQGVEDGRNRRGQTPLPVVTLLTVDEIRKVADKADEGQESTEFMLAFARAIESLVRQNAGLK